MRKAALRTKGWSGPSGVDAVGVRRIVTCKSFKASSVKLCDALALLTRKLCTQYDDLVSTEGLTACRLITLDKGDGSVRPVGVGEVFRRIMAKCVIQIKKPDRLDVTGSLQVSAGQTFGSEAAVHAMNNIFSPDQTDAVLLIDATNAFNMLNRAAALHNISILFPTIATFVIKTTDLQTTS